MWNKEKDKQALTEGWGIFHTGQQDAVHNMYELQRFDEANSFASDEDAARFVVGMIIQTEGKSFHAEAIKFLMENSPNEVDSYIRHSCLTWEFKEMCRLLNLNL